MLRDYFEDAENIVGRYGLEFEVEGGDLPIIRNDKIKSEADGSLREGIEYIFRKPLNKDESLLALQEINTILEASTPTFSFRTSTHVHINMLDVPYEQVLSTIYMLYLLEPCLIEFSGKGRKGNRFCLGLKDAEWFVSVLQNLFQAGNERNFFRCGRNSVDAGDCKYSAINLAPLFYQGSIEVRTLRGTLDENVLNDWLTAFDNILEYVKNFDSWRGIESIVLRTGFTQIIHTIFGHNENAFCSATAFNDLNDQIKLLILLR